MSLKKAEISARSDKTDDEERVSLLDVQSVMTEHKKISVGDSADTTTLSEENLEYLKDFDIEDAWQLLLDLPGCYKVALSADEQKDMGIVVGVNVTSEFPWKQVKCKVVREYLPDDRVPEPEEILEDRFQGMKPDDFVLIGYAPMLSEEADTFLVFTAFDSTKKASEMIKNIELYQRWLLNKSTTKKGHRWVSMGSEGDVDLGLPAERKNIVDVEIQSVFPIKHSEVMFKHRFSSDVRDGYVELIPGDKKFENISRKRVDCGIQSAPAKISLEQQTDPTFPSNAWSQYLYEVHADDEGLDRSENEEDEEKKKKSKPKPASRPGSPEKVQPTPEPEPPKPPPELSTQVKQLMETLKFNQVDMYRDDYEMISPMIIEKYSVPCLKEILCFANISRSINRFVCGVSWYPTCSGLLATSYTFSTMSTSEHGDSKVDMVKRAVIEPNPVLLWSFDDSLHHKLEFETPREVTVLSFCPYDENLLIGGTINGQIIIWDLQNKVERTDLEEVLTAAQSRYRNIMRQYLAWTKPQNLMTSVRPAAISELTQSHKGPVTNIKWLSQKHYITITGQTRESEEEQNRFFVTSSMDGTIAFWNLDAPGDKKKSQANMNHKIPKELIQDVSEYKKLDRVFKPQYIIQHRFPLTSILFNRGKFVFNTTQLYVKAPRYSMRVPVQVTSAPTFRTFQQFMYMSTMLGGVHKFAWEGFDFIQSTDVNKEIVQNSEEFAAVHDGPVLEVRRNPFCSNIFASIGKYILAIWREDYLSIPIFWRKRPAAITRLEWSLDRASVLYMTRSDGTFEAWDLLARTDDASLIDALGGSIITALSEYFPIMPQKFFGIGDYNSSFRVIVLPPAFRSKQILEEDRIWGIIERESKRKVQIAEWETEWYAKNSDILQAKKQQEEQARLDLERLQKEAQMMEELRLRREAEEARKNEMKDKKKLVFDLPERLEKKWDEMNLRRLVNVLMSRRHVDHEKLSQQTAMEKERLEYQRLKKASIKRSFKTIDEDLATIRARLLPMIVEDKERIDMVDESVKSIVEDAEKYDDIEIFADNYMNRYPISGEILYAEFLDRGRQRRLILNKSLGGSTERKHIYVVAKKDGMLENYYFGYKDFFKGEKANQDEKYADLLTTDTEDERYGTTTDAEEAESSPIGDTDGEE